MKFSHISDIHVTGDDNESISLSDFWEFKRLSGFLNLKLFRGKSNFPTNILISALQDMNQYVDHLLLTGDITNISLDQEFKNARKLLEENFFIPKLRSNEKKHIWEICTAIPGNHDCYVTSALEKDLFGKHFGDTHHHEFTPTKFDDRFPSVKVFHEDEQSVVIISLNTGIPTYTFVAGGIICDKQLEKAKKMLQAHEKSFRRHVYKILLLHHPPVQRFKFGLLEYMGGLTSDHKSKIQAFCKENKINLVLHGHTHQPYINTIRHDDGHETIVIDPGSGTMISSCEEEIARYNVYEIVNGKLVEACARVWNVNTKKFETKQLQISKSTEEKLTIIM